MGCDIHLYVEKRENEKWVALYGANPRIKSCEENAKAALESDDAKNQKYWQKQVDELKAESPTVLEGWLYDEKNYNLYAILANVRNDYDIMPIKFPRGLPDDVSKEIYDENFESGGHNVSYYTFQELMDYDWENHTVENEAWVDERTYKSFKETGNPFPCCGDVSGKDIEKVLNKKMNKILKSKYPWEQDKQFYTPIKWAEKHSDIGGYFLDNLNKFILDNRIGNLNDYRIVFWFDS